MRRRNVAYIRVANEDDHAVEIQKNIIDGYAKKCNCKIDYYYIDNGYSGGNFDRPQLKQLLRDVKSKKVTDKIFIKDSSRMCREFSKLDYIIRKLVKRDVSLISTLEEETIGFCFMGRTIKHIIKSQLDRRMMVSERERKIAIVCSPYQKGTLEDAKYQIQTREKLKEKGIYNIESRYVKDKIR